MPYTKTHTHKQTNKHVNTHYQPQSLCTQTGSENVRFEKRPCHRDRVRAGWKQNRPFMDVPLHALLLCPGPLSIHVQNSAFRWTNSHQTPTEIICLKPHLPINSHTGGTFKPGYPTTKHLLLLPNTKRPFNNPSSSIRWSSVRGITHLHSFSSLLPHLTALFLSPTELEEINEMRAGVFPGHFN